VRHGGSLAILSTLQGTESLAGPSKPATLGFAGLEFSRYKDFSEAINTKVWEKYPEFCALLFLFQK
jgi:hypothetical protein